MKKDVLILEMDEEALGEPELTRVKKELEEATGAKVITITKKIGRSLMLQYIIPPMRTHPSIVMEGSKR